jgi:hypothetical protein
VDKQPNVAVLKINGNGLPSVQLGDVSREKVGEWVLVIGSPYGFDYSVTAGSGWRFGSRCLRRTLAQRNVTTRLQRITRSSESLNHEARRCYLCYSQESYEAHPLLLPSTAPTISSRTTV